MFLLKIKKETKLIFFPLLHGVEDGVARFCYPIPSDQVTQWTDPDHDMGAFAASEFSTPSPYQMKGKKERKKEK